MKPDVQTDPAQEIDLLASIFEDAPQADEERADSIVDKSLGKPETAIEEADSVTEPVTPPVRVKAVPTTISLNARSLRSRKAITQEGVLPLKHIAQKPGVNLKPYILAGQISEEGAQALITALSMQRTVFCSDDLSLAKLLLQAAVSDTQISGQPLNLKTPSTAHQLMDAVYQIAGNPADRLLVGCSGAAQPIFATLNLLSLAGATTRLETINSILSPGHCLRSSYTKPKMRVMGIDSL